MLKNRIQVLPPKSRRDQQYTCNQRETDQQPTRNTHATNEDIPATNEKKNITARKIRKIHKAYYESCLRP